MIEVTVLAKKGDGIFDAMKMAPFLYKEKGLGFRWPLKEKMTGRIAGLNFHNQELTVAQCLLHVPQPDNAPAVFLVSLKMDDASQRPFQTFFVINFFSVRQGSFVSACEARISSICSRQSGP